jgi:hypothetical protein
MDLPTMCWQAKNEKAFAILIYLLLWNNGFPRNENKSPLGRSNYQ